MDKQLRAEGKDSWAAQEFAYVLTRPPAPPRLGRWRRTSNIHSLSTRRQLAAVRELWQAREELAQSRDVAPAASFPDSAIIDAARVNPATAEELTRLAVFGGPRQRHHTRPVAGGAAPRPGTARGRVARAHRSVHRSAAGQSMGAAQPRGRGTSRRGAPGNRRNRRVGISARGEPAGPRSGATTLLGGSIGVARSRRRGARHRGGPPMAARTDSGRNRHRAWPALVGVAAHRSPGVYPDQRVEPLRHAFGDRARQLLGRSSPRLARISPREAAATNSRGMPRCITGTVTPAAAISTDDLRPHPPGDQTVFDRDKPVTADISDQRARHRQHPPRVHHGHLDPLPESRCAVSTASPQKAPMPTSNTSPASAPLAARA